MGKKKNQKKIHAEVCEMNRRIIKDRMKDSLYIPSSLDLVLYNQNEYKANRKKKL